MILDEFFELNPKAALAFSGGTDSAFLLHEAKRCGADVKAYYVRSAFQPEFEMNDAVKLAKELDVPFELLEADVLTEDEVVNNPPDRCYHCKKIIFGMIREAAQKDGYPVIMDGTNASDDDSDRPGIRAIKEYSVCSPLRMCGLTKTMIRELSKKAGLFTWDKPAYACLATRIPTGTPITADLLSITEKAEDYLFSLGFFDFRVRYFDGSARIQIQEKQLPLLITRREEILKKLEQWYKFVDLDLKMRG